jgi:preprotein translocase subunit SecA
VLEGEDLQEQVTHFRSDVLKAYIAGATAEGTPEEWDLEGLWTALKAVYPVSITVDEVVEQAGGLMRVTPELVETEILSDATHAYAEREETIGSENMRQLERRVVLSVLDRKWREHLYEMDYLKEGIGLRAMAQRDPLVEYQREGFQLFNAMTDAIKEESVGYLFNLEVQVAEAEQPAVSADAAAEAATAGGAAAALGGGARLVAKGIDGPAERAPLQYSAPSTDGDGEVVKSGDAGGAGAAPAAGGAGNRADRRKAAKRKR